MSLPAEMLICGGEEPGGESYFTSFSGFLLGLELTSIVFGARRTAPGDEINLFGWHFFLLSGFFFAALRVCVGSRGRVAISTSVFVTRPPGRSFSEWSADVFP